MDPPARMMRGYGFKRSMHGRKTSRHKTKAGSGHADRALPARRTDAQVSPAGDRSRRQAAVVRRPRARQGRRAGAGRAPRRAADAVLRRPALQAAGGAAGHGRQRQGRHAARGVRPHEPARRAHRRLEGAHRRRARARLPWWRIHRAVPGAGEVVVFNRSHYEDVLVPVVNGGLTPRADRAALPADQRVRAHAHRDTAR